MTGDLKRTGYHKCNLMPENEFAEKQSMGWHIHRKDVSHSEYRKEIWGSNCPYCNISMDESAVLINIEELKNKLRGKLSWYEFPFGTIVRSDDVFKIIDDIADEARKI